MATQVYLVCQVYKVRKETPVFMVCQDYQDPLVTEE